MDTFLLILELAGTLAFAVSGAITGLKKNMDLFGVCILGLTTAVGGGVIRDVILGNTPPATFQDPIYAMVALGTSLVLFLPGIRRLLMWDQRLYDLTLLVMDSAGLGIFTVMGIRIAYSSTSDPTLFLLVFVGVVTGVGGAAGCDGRRYALHLCQARLRLRVSGRGPYLRGALGSVGRAARHSGRHRRSDPYPLSLCLFPLEPAPCPRLKQDRPPAGRRSFRCLKRPVGLFRQRAA